MRKLRLLECLCSSGRTLRRLRDDRSGVAMIEFALSVPIMAALGCYTIEVSNYALTSMKVNQIALNLADNASRVGLDSATLTTEQLREVDMNDALQAARYQGSGINLTTNGRIVVSSLENIKQSYDSAAVQRIHWQRCIGMKSGTSFDSHYGTTTTTAGTTATSANAGTTSTGMGDTGYSVSAPANTGVMYVEINYQYQPILSTYFLGSPTTR